ncbi:MAG: HipA N-terminal domain-containing protein [Bacteroidales bacterium]|nr:HipA N-terminal domain-containing protein [Bacteroidales bacterium]
MRKAKVFFNDIIAGVLSETEEGFVFQYDPQYVQKKDAEPVSLTLPIKSEPYLSKVMFPFFDGLIPEGWLLEIAEKNWKINNRDRMGLLLACCRDCIGAVSIIDDSNIE